MGNNYYLDVNERIWYGAAVHMEAKRLVIKRVGG